MQASGCFAAYDRLLPHQPVAYQTHVPWLAEFTPEEVRYAMIAVRREARASLAEFEQRIVGARREMRGTPGDSVHEDGGATTTRSG